VCLRKKQETCWNSYKNVKLHRQIGRCVGASVSCQRVAGMYLLVEQILKEELLTLCLREDTVWWISRELKQGLGFIVDKNSIINV
jgi:hypothetical protein